MTKVKLLIARIKKIKNPFDKRDAFIFGGLLIMAVGLWIVAAWLSLAVTGFLIYCTGIFARKLA